MNFDGLTAATVFCADPDPATIAKRLESLGLAADLADDWSSVEVTGEHGEMTVTREMFEPDSAFSRAVLVAHNGARLVKRDDPAARARVLGLLESCDMLLRFDFSPALAAASWSPGH